MDELLFPVSYHHMITWSLIYTPYSQCWYRSSLLANGMPRIGRRLSLMYRHVNEVCHVMSKAVTGIMSCFGSMANHVNTDRCWGTWRSRTNSLRWRHNDHGGVSNHQSRGRVLNCLFWCRRMKTSKFRVTGLCAGNSPGPVNSPHK